MLTGIKVLNSYIMLLSELEEYCVNIDGLSFYEFQLLQDFLYISIALKQIATPAGLNSDRSCLLGQAEL